MTFKPPKTQPRFADLKGILAQTRQLDEPSYQLLQTLIERLTQYQVVLNDELASKGEGVEGPKGDKGDPGAGLTILGSVPSAPGDLPPTGEEGDGWISSDTGHLWVWDGTQWVDAGLIQGPPGPEGDVGPQGPTGPASTVPGPPGPTGSTGSQGPAGPTGSTGSPGPAGERWFSGTGANPPPDIGQVTGDWYLDSTTGNYYECTNGVTNTWALRGNLKGPIGATGAASTVPGPAGPTGAQGVPGPEGPQGPIGPTPALVQSFITANAEPTLGSHFRLAAGSGINMNFDGVAHVVTVSSTGATALHAPTHKQGGTDQLDVKQLGGFTGSPSVFLSGAADFRSVPVGLHATTHGYQGSDIITSLSTEVAVEGPGSVLHFKNPSGTANYKHYRFVNYGNDLRLESMNDAAGIQSTPIQFMPNGTVNVGWKLTTLNTVDAGAGVNSAGPVVASAPEGIYAHGTAGYARIHLRNLNASPTAQTFVLLNYQGNLYLAPTSDTGTGPAVGTNWGENGLVISRTGNVSIPTGVYERNRTFPMGEWQNVPFLPGNFYGVSPMVWTVGSAAIIRNKYCLIGKTCFWSVFISWFSGGNALSGTPSNGINMYLPGGLLSTGNQVQAIDYVAGVSGAPITYGLYASIYSGHMTISKFDNSNFALSDIPGMQFTIMFETL